MATGKRSYKVNLDDLISVVRQYPFLYDPNDPAYRDSAMRDNWWQAIAERFKTPTSVILKKWKSLKDRYIRERRIYVTKKKFYDNKAYISSPRWRLYPVLEAFLDNKLSMRFRRTRNPVFQTDNVPTNPMLQMDTQEGENGHNEWRESENQTDTQESLRMTLNSMNKGANHSSIKLEYPEEATLNTVTITPVSTFTRSQIDDEDSYHLHTAQHVNIDRENSEEMLSVLHSISSTLTELSSKINVPAYSEDEIHYYVLSLAQRVRNLSERKKHEFKMKVEQLVYDLEHSCTSEQQDPINWWKTAVLYQIYPRSFADSNGDGAGDLKGIQSKLDYIKYMGIHGTWLSPIYKSPMKDFGYDVSDYIAIDPIFGTMDDFDDYVKESKNKNLKVIMDFVPNHSSEEHVWFKKSERKEDPYTDYYVWVDGKDSPNGPQPPNNWQSMFGGSAWTWSPIRKQFYYHQFLKEQPDLNFRNPQVREEMKNAFRFWFDKGVDGFRIDAITHLFEDQRLLDEPPLPSSTANPGEYSYYNHLYTWNLPEVFDVIREWKEVFDEYEKKMELMMVESAMNITFSLPYFGNDTNPLVDMPFNFELIWKLKKSMTGQDIYNAVWGWLEFLPETKWSNWIIGNHDQNRIANRTHADLIDAFNVILLLLRGTPITYYGEEIGMVDNFIAWDQIQDPYGTWFGRDHYTEYNRDPERTPMQWDDSAFSGFTEGNSSWLPVNENYKQLNVEKQKTEPRSHLNTYRKTALLKKQQAIINGSIDFPLITEDIFSFTRTIEYHPGYVVVVNFGNDTQAVDLASKQTENFHFPDDGILEIMSDKVWPSIMDQPSFRIKLNQIELPPRQVIVIKFEPVCESEHIFTVGRIIMNTYLILVAFASFTQSVFATQDSKNWWKEGVFYQIYPRSYADSDGDGVGDLKGIESKLNYVKYLGVHATWLSPIYKSPMKDFGYDVADYIAIDPLFGTMDDFDSYVNTSKKKDLKVIMDFVPNHSSNEHEWFLKSERREDPYTDYYLWHNGTDSPDGPKPPNNWKSIFGGAGWEWSPIRKQFYYHMFLKEQPDLNYRNPKVREEMKNVIRFWLNKGVDGFRIDAIPFLFEDKDFRDEPYSPGSTAKPDEYNYYDHIYTTNLPEVLDVLGDWREVCQEFEERDGAHRLLMAEIYLNATTALPYYGNETHPLADFPFNFELIMQLHGNITGQMVYDAIQSWQRYIPITFWSNWVIGNHDQNRIANRTHVELIDTFNMIYLLLKGTPVTYYGEEIGMVDKFIPFNETKDPYGKWFGPDEYTKYNRDPERTPMQWDESAFAGFTTGNQTWLPVNDNYKQQLNVQKQKQQPRSHLNIYRKVAALKEKQSIKNGSIYFPLVTKDIFSFTRTQHSFPGYVIIANFGNSDQTVDLTSVHTEKFYFPLHGIESKLDYIKYLGVHATWLSPVYTSPMKDFGYDISNYTSIDPLFGTMTDFESYVKTSKQKGLKVLIDFVPNHSSNKHEWFLKSERREEPYSDYYVWVDGHNSLNGSSPPNNWQGVFGGSAWEWSPIRKQFYYHQFLKEQPDLNFRNPKVRKEMENVIRFWFDKGVDGFRIDAVPHLFEDTLLRDEPPLMVLETAMNASYSLPYFGNDTHPLADMPFNFEIIWHIRGMVSGEEVYNVIWGWFKYIPESKWSNWVLGNHDQNRIANRTHVDLIDAFNMISLLLKGTPVTYYGEEIGMVDKFIAWNEIQDPYGKWFGPDEYTKWNRDPQRTPMQWDGTSFAGFTRGNSSWLPVNDNYKQLNVKEQQGQPRSHLQTYRKLVALKKRQAIVNGSIHFPLITKDIFSFTRTIRSFAGFVTVVNFGNETQIVNLTSNKTANFIFPSHGTIEVLSDKIWPSIGSASLLRIDLAEIKLPPRQAIVISFQPIWLQE
uniref:alpha-glucosidase n=1 Tax=Strigamia maritima TaxID=126957 RepID=T1JA57_STRMM